MQSVGRVLATAAAMTAFGLSGAPARTVPAGMPPASSYTDGQFVDSAGCVFLRHEDADGRMAWEPRVTRDNQPLCGYTPSTDPLDATDDSAFGAAAGATTAAEGAGTDAAGTAASETTSPKVTAPKTTVETGIAPVAGPAPALNGSASNAPGSVLASATPSPAAPDSLPVRPLAAPPEVLLVSARTLPGSWTACPPGTAFAQRYQLSDGRVVLRCDARVDNPVAFINGAAVDGLRVSAATPAARGLAATDIWTERLATALDAQAPPRPELLEHAGAGIAVASATPPKSANTPRQPEPKTPVEASGREAAKQKADPPSAAAAAAPQPTSPQSAQPQSGQPQTDAAEDRTKAAAQPGTGQFVQIGAYSRAVNADRVKDQLRALGMPVATGTARIRGKDLITVYSGPFPPAEAAAALRKIRRGGFADAIMAKGF